MITPILKDPKEQGGTLYTFPSASRDLTRAFSNSEYEFAFSHFACLNLPDFRYGSYECVDSDSESDIYEGNDPKGIYLDDLRENCIGDVGGKIKINTALKWHMQSYVMNYEVAILNGFSLDARKYDNEILRTPSERIFFNWLQKVGAIKFSGHSETLDGYGYNVDINHEILSSESDLESANKTQSYRIGNKLYTWKGGKWRSRVLVSKTVQYIGTIDMINNVNIDYDSFNEIYLNIPAGVGGSTNVYFDNIFDDNYQDGEIIYIDKYCDSDKKEYIIGRGSDGDVTLKAIYDSPSDHSYKIDNGYCINFNDSKYGNGLGKTGLEAMNISSEEDFEFNCILIYYRIRKGSGKWYTNLYGVLFLEEATTSDYNPDLNKDDERVAYIQRYPKFKNGNSWGLKLDLKIDAQPDSQLELRDKDYNDPNGGGIGMQMFTEALMHLNDCVKLFYEVKKENTDIEERLYTLENIMSGVDTINELSNSVNILRNNCEILQPSINSFDGRLNDIEGRLAKLESDLGYLIRNITKLQPSINSFEGRLNDIEGRLAKLESDESDYDESD